MRFARTQRSSLFAIREAQGDWRVATRVTLAPGRLEVHPMPYFRNSCHIEIPGGWHGKLRKLLMWRVNGILVSLKSDSFLRSLDRRHVSNSASYTPRKMSPEVLKYFVAGCLCMFRRFKQLRSAFPRLLFLSILLYFIYCYHIYVYICYYYYYLLFWKKCRA